MDVYKKLFIFVTVLIPRSMEIGNDIDVYVLIPEIVVEHSRCSSFWCFDEWVIFQVRGAYVDNK